MKYSSAYVLVAALIATAAWLGLTSPRIDEQYRRNLEKEFLNREKELKSENGWLNLAGLFWLDKTNSKIGSSTGNEILLPKEKADGILGEFSIRGTQIWFKPASASVTDKSGNPVTAELQVFGDSIKAPVLQHQSLRWFIIKRGSRYAVRLRDLKHESVQNFKGIERYPINELWRIKATFKTPDVAQTLKITDVVGTVNDVPLAGTAFFEIAGKPYQLQATKSEGKLFFVFGDQTNGPETYGGGRFLYSSLPDKDGNIVLDFNLSVNPPCAFTPFATCPLPTRENILTTGIPAGEKSYHYETK